MTQIFIPRQQSPRASQPRIDYLKRAKELAALINSPQLEPQERERLIMRIGHLLFLEGKTWQDIGLSSRALRARLSQDALERATTWLQEARRMHRGSRNAAHYVRLLLAKAGRAPRAIGTTATELRRLGDGTFDRWEWAQSYLQQKASFDEHLIEILCNPRLYPRARIGTTDAYLHKRGRTYVRHLLTQVREKYQEGNNGAPSSVKLIKMGLEGLKMRPEQIGTSQKELAELAYPRNYHRMCAEQNLADIREHGANRYRLRYLHSHARRARCSLHELGTSRKELQDLKDKGLIKGTGT